jgi:hypothetical protein
MASSSNAVALALFSGGLDSILASKIIQEQGIRVIALHFVSPFFGKPEKIPHWREIYGLEIIPVDVSAEYIRLLAGQPTFGFGSVLNPCVDCKILMLRHARRLMDEYGACCVISGEVLGQRPMSQRRDALNAISRDSGLRGKLLRPLCAQHMDPTEAELAGIVDRSRLLAIAGRGRKQQMALAERFHLTEIPTPAGGCRLTEKENARSYWPVLRYAPEPTVTDFRLANTGRQYWHTGDGGVYWLIVGRNQADNDAIMTLAGERDILLKTRDFPGPIALARHMGEDWPTDALRSAAAFTASYANKAVRYAQERDCDGAVRAHPGSLDNPGQIVMIRPSRETEPAWREFTWDETRKQIKESALR